VQQAEREAHPPWAPLLRRGMGLALVLGGLALLAESLPWMLSEGGVSLVRSHLDQLRLAPHELVWLGGALRFVLPAQLALVAGAWLLRGPRGPHDTPPLARLPPRSFALLLSLAALALLAVVRYAWLDGGPLTDDEWAYHFQARTFALGRLYVPAPPDPRRFDYLFLALRGSRWFCTLQPGLALSMLPGVWLSDDPFLSLWPLHALLPAAAWALGRRLGGEAAGRWAGLVLLASPWYLLLGATVEPYALCALLVLIWAGWLTGGLGAAAGPAAGSPWRRGLGLGLLLGGLLLLRGFEFGIVGLASAAALALRLRRGGTRRAALHEGAGAALALLPFAALQLGYDWALTGHPLSVPMTFAHPVRFWGFGAGVYNQHGPVQGLRLWGGNLLRAGLWLQGAPLGLLVALAACARAARVRGSGALLGFAGLYLALLVPYSMAGVADMGPVYLFPLGALAAVALGLGLAQGLPRLPRWGAPPAAGVLLSALVCALGSCAPLAFVQARAVARNALAPYRALEAEAGDRPTLALVRRVFPAPTGWVFGLRAPHPTFAEPLVTVWAQPGDDAQALAERWGPAFAVRRPVAFRMDYGAAEAPSGRGELAPAGPEVPSAGPD